MPNFVATGRYLEDFMPGDTLLSPGRTLTSADIELFAEWTGDNSATHLRSPDGRRVIAQTLIVNIADALMQRTGIVEGTGYCNLGWRWRFERAVQEFDTLWASARFDRVRPSGSVPGTGIVEMTVSVLNQDEETVAVGEWAVMVLSRAGAAAKVS